MEIRIIAHALIYNKDGKCLFIRRSKQNDVLPEIWDIPGGTIEQDESVMNGLSREVAEEVNLKIENIKPLYFLENDDKVKNVHFIKIIFKADLVDSDIRLNPEEHDNFVWADRSSVQELRLVDYLKNMHRESYF